jgi:hypothetical protein
VPWWAKYERLMAPLAEGSRQKARGERLLAKGSWQKAPGERLLAKGNRLILLALFRLLALGYRLQFPGFWLSIIRN